MARQRILISCKLGEGARKLFDAAENVETSTIEINDEAALIAAVPGFHALIVRSNVRVTAEALAAGKDLTVVGRAGIGTDNIDLKAATSRGIAVVNAPGGNATTTAEHSLAMLFSLARKIPGADRSMRAGRWEKNRFMGRELYGKALGVLGAGRVGSEVAKKALALGMRVLVHDPYLNSERAAALGVLRVSLENLLTEADFITVHTPLNDQTRGLLGRANLAKCKPGVMIVNCARGPIVDEDALHEAITSGRVAGAALDVYPVEPPKPHPLYTLEEVVMTPHLGASTVEAQDAVAEEIARNVLSYLKNQTAPTLQNAPVASEEALCVIWPHMELAAKLGRFLAQAAERPVEALKVTTFGEAAAHTPELIAAAAVRGYLSAGLTERVNSVNALAIAAERGINVSWGSSTDAEDFMNLVEVEISGSWGRHTASGTIFGKRDARLVGFDSFRLDARPQGELILVLNTDKPGVIGAVGTKLGEMGINMAGFYNGRASVGGKAISLINVDGEITAETLEALRGVANVASVKRITL